MDESGTQIIFHESSITVVGWDEVGARNVFHDAGITVVGWHVMCELEPISYFVEPALLWLAGTVIGKDGTHNTHHRASIAVVGWHGYGRGRSP